VIQHVSLSSRHTVNKYIVSVYSSKYTGDARICC